MLGYDPLAPEPWHGEPSSWQAVGQKEFLVSVELWCSAKTASGSLRKSHLPRKTLDKRDAASQGLGPEERRLREKPSWFRYHVNSTAANGNWRSARCKLAEEREGCTLNIYVDENILHDAIFIHLLRCTDIRPVDRSLFFRSDCLGIRVQANQRWLGVNTEEMVYMKFPDADAINTWIALLRSHAIAEIYGRNLSPHDGGLYRMWRQVHMEIVQARNLGPPKPQSSSSSGLMPPNEYGEYQYDGVEMDVSCEIVIDDILFGRTTVKRGSAPEWHEQFTFSDLPPFGKLLINVYREKRLFKTHILGTIHIVLSNCRRGEKMDGWYPVFMTTQGVADMHAGEIRLKMKVDEEIILPSESYGPMLECMVSTNMLDLLHDLEQELKLVHIAEHIMAIAVMKKTLVRDLTELAEREVNNTALSQNTLFRGNTVLTKTVELAMNMFGKPFLEASIGPVIRRLIAEKVHIEVDPLRSGKGTKDQEKNVEHLVAWCKEFWNNIYAVRGECPSELRELFRNIRRLVEDKFGGTNRNMRWQSVSAFCFLRFIVPAILHPHLFGISHGMPSPAIQRTLTLIAKVLQSVANLNEAVHKEEYMRGVNTFIRESMHAMTDYIKQVSTPLPNRDQIGSSSQPSTTRHERIQVMYSLRERKSTMPTLHREALLFLPYLLDLPRHLAVLTSAVARSARQSSKGKIQRRPALEAFVGSSLAVDRRARDCVAQLKRYNRSSQPPRLSLSSNRSSTETVRPTNEFRINSTSGNASFESASTRSDKGKRRMSLQSSRPLTAPSTSDADRQDAHRFDISTLPPLPTGPLLMGRNLNTLPPLTKTKSTVETGRTSAATTSNVNVNITANPPPAEPKKTRRLFLFSKK